jgi:hypothetical protein
MMFLRGKESRSTATVTSAVRRTATIPAPVSGQHGVAAMIKRLIRNDAVRTLIGVLIVAALVAVALLTLYYVGPNGFPTVHQHRIYKPQTAVDQHRGRFGGDEGHAPHRVGNPQQQQIEFRATGPAASR